MTVQRVLFAILILAGLPEIGWTAGISAAPASVSEGQSITVTWSYTGTACASVTTADIIEMYESDETGRKVGSSLATTNNNSGGVARRDGSLVFPAEQSVTGLVAFSYYRFINFNFGYSWCGDTNVVRVFPEPRAAVSGRIQGTSVAGVRVTLAGLGRYPDGRRAEAITDTAGRFLIGNLQTIPKVAWEINRCRQTGLCKPIRVTVKPKYGRTRFTGTVSGRLYERVYIDPANPREITGVTFTARER